MSENPKSYRGVGDGGKFAKQRKLAIVAIVAILAIFFHFMQPKWDQGTQRSTLIRSRTHLGPSIDPVMALKCTQHGPFYIGYIFAFYASKMGSRDTGDRKDYPHWV